MVDDEFFGNIKGGIFGGLIFGTIAALITATCVQKSTRYETIEEARPSSALKESDLNHDGIADMVVETGYGRIPLYGVEKDGSVIYVSADEMLKLHPESIIDYNRIEEMLNKYEFQPPF